MKDSRRHYPHPQHRFVRGVVKVGVRDLLELRAELGQFRGLGTPLDAYAESAVSIVNQKEIGKAGV